jgi:NADH-ubiquinone oxidoreductase chain 5
MFLSLWFLIFGLIFLGLLESELGFSGIVEFEVFGVGSNVVSFSLFFDGYRLLFCYILFMIVSSVFAFSSVYMRGDCFEVRFNYLVVLFVLSMVVLIVVPDLLFTLIGWDGLGVSRFLLIIYYLSGSSMSAGLKTYLINRLGDGLFVVSLALLIFQGNWNLLSLDYSLVFSFFFVLGCFTKSAQFPFGSWLPDAMAAPTPVSALVHSSTLVTSGLFLLIRFSHVLPDCLYFLLGLVGFWTMFLASLAACLEYDSKKVIAYSTLSQLGFIVVSISMGFVSLAFFHLLAHAIFKALLFICAGYKICIVNHFQDVRFLNSSFFQGFFKNFVMTVCVLSLMGFPFLAGFYSKDSILESGFWVWKKIYYIFVLFSLPLTSYYSVRLILLLSGDSWRKKVVHCFDTLVSGFSWFILLFLAIRGGYFFSRSEVFLAVGLVSSFFDKVVVFVLVFCGVFVAVGGGESLRYFRFCYFSELGFLKTFNGYFFLDWFSELFLGVYQSLDLGYKSWFLGYLNDCLVGYSSLLKELSLFYNSLKRGVLVICFLFLIFLLLV